MPARSNNISYGFYFRSRDIPFLREASKREFMWGEKEGERVEGHKGRELLHFAKKKREEEKGI